jgi:hypothetical protein
MKAQRGMTSRDDEVHVSFSLAAILQQYKNQRSNNTRRRQAERTLSIESSPYIVKDQQSQESSNLGLSIEVTKS